MQATQPLRTVNPIAAALIATVAVLAAIAAGLGLGNAISPNAGGATVPAAIERGAPLQLDPDSKGRPGQRGLHVNVPQ